MIPLDPAVLAIDAGSSHVRVSVVVLADGSVTDCAVGPPLAPGGELDVEALWGDLTDLVGALEHHEADIRAVAVGAQLGLVLLGAGDAPLRPALTWDDKRASVEAEQLAETLPAEVLQSIGRPMSPELAVGRLRWLKKHEGRVFRRTRRVISIKDALVTRLTGHTVTDETSASYSGLFDVRHRMWANALVQIAGIEPGMLAPVMPGSSAAGALSPGAARALGLQAGLPVAVGAPDGTLGAIGAGAVRSGVTVDVAGTTDVLLHTTDRPVTDPRQRVVLNAHPLPGLWTIGGPTGLTGGVVQWTARLLGFDSVEAAQRSLDDDARLAPEPPVFVPTLDGSRFPTWRPDAMGLIASLRPEHRSADIFWAAQQGVAFTVREGLEALRSLGAEIDEVLMVGGGARPSTLELRSDAWGLPVVALAEREATTIGAAILGGMAAGCFDELDSAVRTLVHRAGRYEPRSECATATARAWQRWKGTSHMRIDPAKVTTPR